MKEIRAHYEATAVSCGIGHGEPEVETSHPEHRWERVVSASKMEVLKWQEYFANSIGSPCECTGCKEASQETRREEKLFLNGWNMIKCSNYIAVLSIFHGPS